MTQTWQQLKDLINEVDPDSLNLTRLILINEVDFYSKATSEGNGNNIEDQGFSNDIETQTWGQLLDILNDLNENVLNEVRHTTVSGQVYNSVATLSDDGGPKTVKDSGGVPD